jgi:hypothetical protein
MSIDQINNLYASYEALQKQGVEVTREEYKSAMDEMLKELDPDMSNLNSVLEKHFGGMLRSGEEFAGD